MVHLQQEFTALRYAVYVGFSKLVYLPRDLMQFFSPQPSFLLVMECEVPEHPLAVRYMQKFADELFDLLFIINSVVSQDEVLILGVKEVLRDPSFHKVLPAYDILASS